MQIHKQLSYNPRQKLQVDSPGRISGCNKDGSKAFRCECGCEFTCGQSEYELVTCFAEPFYRVKCPSVSCGREVEHR
jgi:hypothetical protein